MADAMVITCPVAQTGYGEAKGPAQWTRIQNEWRAAGHANVLYPILRRERLRRQSRRALWTSTTGRNNADPSDDVVDGLFNFGGFASGDNALRASQKNTSYDTAVDASPGMRTSWPGAPRTSIATPTTASSATEYSATSRASTPTSLV